MDRSNGTFFGVVWCGVVFAEMRPHCTMRPTAYGLKVHVFIHNIGNLCKSIVLRMKHMILGSKLFSARGANFDGSVCMPIA